jgi:hypothetical protein
MNKRSRNTNALALARQTVAGSPLAFGLFTLITLALLSLFSAEAFGQAPPTQPPANLQQGSTNKDYLGPSGDSIRPYRPAGRDPFKKVMPPKEPKKTSTGTIKQPKPLGFPSLEERRAKYRTMVDDNIDRGITEPNPVVQYLVSELEVTGVFRDDSGFGAFVKAVPTGTTMFIRRGARCFNGEVLRIEDDTSDSGAKVTFRQESFVEIDNKQVKRENIVSKQPAAAPKAG